jgi:hypothetical protein
MFFFHYKNQRKPQWDNIVAGFPLIPEISEKFFLPVCHKKYHKDFFGEINFTGIFIPLYKYQKTSFKKKEGLNQGGF